MIRLATTRAELRPLFPQGMTPEQAHAAVTEGARRLSQLHASLFARPVREGDAIHWTTEGERMARYADLDAESRATLLAEAGRMLSDLRRETERAAAEGGALAGLWPVLSEIPSFDMVFAVDGRPVIAGWGHVAAAAPAPLGLLARFDDGVRWMPPPRRPWGVWAATLGGLAAFALLVGLLAPLLAWRFLTAPEPVCRVAEGDMEAMTRIIAEERQERELRTELARLEQELGRRRLTCPLPRAPEPQRAAEPPPPPPQPSPERRAEIPRAEETPLPLPPPAPPPPPQEPQQEAAFRPPPGTQACNEETQSGSSGETRTRHYLGARPGPVTLDFDNRLVPDQIEVQYRGRTVAQTQGPVSGRGQLHFDWRPQGNDHVVTVVVIAPYANTLWRYRLNCPVPP